MSPAPVAASPGPATGAASTTGPSTAGPATARPAVPAPAPEPAGPRSPEPGPEEPAFTLRLGGLARRISLVAEGVRPTPGAYEVDLQPLGLSVPGLALRSLSLRTGADGEPRSGTLTGNVSAPFVRGEVHLDVDAEGNVSGGMRLRADIGVLGDPFLEFTYREGALDASATFEGTDLQERIPIPNVTLEEGRATVRFQGGDLAGDLFVRFRHAALGSGDVRVTLDSSGASGSGSFTLDLPVLEGTEGSVTVAENELSARLDLSPGAVVTPVPNLQLSELTGFVALENGAVSGSLGLTAAYLGLATVTLSEVSFNNRGFASGSGSLILTAPPFEEISGTFGVTGEGRLHGGVTVPARRIPIPALRGGEISVTVRPDGGVDVAGSGTVVIGSLVEGDFEVAYAEGMLRLGADVTVNVPHLDQVRGRFEYQQGELQGEVQAGVTVGPVSGNVTLWYRNRGFGGEGRLDYSVGRFDGWVLVRVDEAGAISGEGQATVRITDRLIGTIGLTVFPDLNVDARGELVFADEVTIFDAWEFERNFFSFDQSFPLWGITIPVVGSIGIIAEVHASAGFRANFGPGVFRNIRAEGEVSTRPDAEPTFSISGDFHIPAGAEVVVTIGGGIGLAALVAQLTGGIDLEGIAGVYGALTITPTFAYRDGAYRLRGEAFLEAAAQLRAGINAYARIVAGIGWLSGEVWRQDWRLAQAMFDLGWSLGLRASLEYELGQPFRPDVRFDEVAVDPTALIRSAVPRSGEPVSAPARPATPQASFQATEGAAQGAQATAAPAGAAGAPPTPAAAGAPAGPAPAAAGAPRGAMEAPAPAAGGAPSAPGPGATPEAPPRPQLGPPAAASKPKEERTIDEQYEVYLWDKVRHAFRRKSPTAPADEELVRRLSAPIADEGEEPEETVVRLEEAAEKVTERGLEPDEAPIPADAGETPGKPLSPAMRSEMETIFDTDLSEVRVHEDEAAGERARALGAEAFTVGKEIYFAPSRRAEPGQRELLAHELTHVVQQEAEAAVAPEEELEEEAEEAARAVARGERPAPVVRRGDAGPHRTAAATGGGSAGEGGSGRSVASGEKITFSEQEWNRIRTQLEQDPTLGPTIRGLLDKGAVTERAKEEVYDPDQDAFVQRGYIPMRFPEATALSHKNVFGDTQIARGDRLTRSGEDRADKEQRLLSDLMYAERFREAREAGGETAEEPLFTRSEQGSYEKEPRWTAYRETDVWRAATTHENAPAGISADQQTTASQHNLTMSRTGFDLLWSQGWVYFPRPSGGVWRRVALPGSGRGTEVGEDTGTTDAEIQPVMVADYQSHHVIPLWLRSASGRPAGDRLENLVPWHKNAHQTNHAVHHQVPEDVREITGVPDYRDFSPGTSFLIHETVSGTAHPAGVPAVRLGARDESKHGSTNPPTRYVWLKGEGDRPPWLT